MQDPEIKDIFRFMLVMVFSGVGYDPEVLVTRFQIAIAFYMTPGFLPFF